MIFNMGFYKSVTKIEKNKLLIFFSLIGTLLLIGSPFLPWYIVKFIFGPFRLKGIEGIFWIEWRGWVVVLCGMLSLFCSFKSTRRLGIIQIIIGLVVLGTIFILVLPWENIILTPIILAITGGIIEIIVGGIKVRLALFKVRS